MSVRKRRVISLCILCAGIVLVVAGIFRGEAVTVFKKATRICLECIGIG
ncbi:MAG: hypothetical protein J6Y16_02765 [Treponema sp.]|nr:hypothetical protein [Treponema sp.]